MEVATEAAGTVPETEARPWSLATRIAFRFCFTYFGLYCIETQTLRSFPIPTVDLDLFAFWPARQIVWWVAAHLFHITPAPGYARTGSGDKMFDWVLAFCLVIIASVATGVWSVLDRKRKNYASLLKWFQLFLRLALASQMVAYGLNKVVPTQMPYPPLFRLVEPLGDFSPLGILWEQMGASQVYEIFTGCAELLGAVLLLFPRTSVLGALVCLAELIEVFTLNMTYDVPVKLISFHLILMALFLLAPEYDRLAGFFLFNRRVEPSTGIQFASPKGRRIAIAAKTVFLVLLIGTNAYDTWKSWFSVDGPGAPRSPLYGIWEVEQLSIDGQLRPPLLSERSQWRRVIWVDSEVTFFQHMDDSREGYWTVTDAGAKTLTLVVAEWKVKGKFTYRRLSANELELNGDFDKRPVHMQLRLLDRNTFPLVNRGFHWIQEEPFSP